MDGYDDQCGAARRAPIVGLGTPNPDGSIGFGLNIVTTPGGRGVQVDARIALATLSGSWSDSAGNSGAFAFNGNTGGTSRPLPAPAVPTLIGLRTDGGLVAGGILGAGTIPMSGPGVRMMWHPRKAAFRVGNVAGAFWDDVNIGTESVAFNKNTTASAPFSAAFGDSTIATGQVSTAMGYFTAASGVGSTAMGSQTTASGVASTAMGSETTAAGAQSVAMGLGTIATGAHSFAMGDASQAAGGNSLAVGSFARALGFESIALGQNTTTLTTGGVALGSNATAAGGSFTFGDRSTNNVVSTAVANQFAARAAGGVVFYTNAALTAGVTLAAGGSGWGVVSDANLKENFRDLAADDVLARIARMPVREWNYMTQDASIRHMGPTAQDFHAAFGLGESELRINTIDADGVALAAVKALEARTTQMTRENDELRTRLARLEALLEKK